MPETSEGRGPGGFSDAWLKSRQVIELLLSLDWTGWTLTLKNLRHFDTVLCCNGGNRHYMTSSGDAFNDRLQSK